MQLDCWTPSWVSKVFAITRMARAYQVNLIRKPLIECLGAQFQTAQKVAVELDRAWDERAQASGPRIGEIQRSLGIEEILVVFEHSSESHNSNSEDFWGVDDMSSELVHVRISI